MEFKSKEELEFYLNNFKELGSGSQGTAYYDAKNNQVIKVFHDFYDDDFDSTRFKKEDVLRFKEIVNNTYIFPTDVLTLNNSVIGYLSKYVTGASLYSINPLNIKLDNMIKAIEPVFKATKKITRDCVATYDVMYNIMYNNTNFYIIDTDEYSYSDKCYDELLRDNQNNFDISIKYFLVDCIFDDLVESNKILDEMYKTKECNSLEFLKELRKVLSEYNGSKIDKLCQVEKYTNKTKRMHKLVRYV